MANIVEGLFGLTPSQAQQQQQADIYKQSMLNANMPQMQSARSALFQGGAGIAQAGAGMLGMVNPEVESAQRTQSLMQGADLNTPEGLRAASERMRQSGDLQRSFALSQLADQKEAEIQSGMVKTTQMAENLAQAEKAARETEQKGEYQEIGVPNKPDWRQRVKMNPDGSYVPIGSPYQISAGVSASGREEQPPKNLTREARLKWELDTGRIDQETYDAAISATPGAKLKAEKVSAASTALTGFEAVERNLNTLYDPKTKSLTSAAKPLFGKYAQYRPELLQSQETVDASAALESLTNQVMMANLADAKERVGQSFGSMQVQEWDKFTQQLTSLKRGMSEKSAADAMEYVKNFIKTKRNVLNTALGSAKIEQPNISGGWSIRKK